MLVLLACFTVAVLSSSHSEAPGTARGPNTDLTDFYTFMTARGNVAFVMNVAGLTQSQAGPNYNPLNNDFVYQIHVDNDGDNYEDVTFQFVTGYRYANNGRGIEVPVNGVNVPIPLSHVIAAGPIAYNAADGTTTGLNAEEYYRVRVLRGDDYSEALEEGPFAGNHANGEVSHEFTKAYDNAGTKSFDQADDGTYTKYETYVQQAATYEHVFFPGCAKPAKMFVGPRRESFGIALGEVFDAINIDHDPIFGSTRDFMGSGDDDDDDDGTKAFDGNSIDRFGVISFVIEVAPECVQSARRGEVLGAWASVRKLEHRDSKHYAGEQTTRLGNPLVNELLIGTTYKNEWNSRHPSGDERFNDFLLNPVVPFYIQALFGVNAPAFKREDLVTVFHKGIPGLNRPRNDGADDDDDDKRFADLLRINITAAGYKPCVDVTTGGDGGPVLVTAGQSPLGVIQGDAAGYPNGRRLGDDVVDITLRVAMGLLCVAEGAAFCGQSTIAGDVAASAVLKYTDQAPCRACMFKCDTSGAKYGSGATSDFPFLNPPIPGNHQFTLRSPYTVSQFIQNCFDGSPKAAQFSHSDNRAFKQ